MTDREAALDETAGLPIAPSLAPTLVAADIPAHPVLVDRRVVTISGIAILIAITAGLVAQLLTRLIGLITNLAFYGRFSTAFVSPADHRLGAWVVAIPVLGGVVVGLMARFGSKAIRGHGIPEAMEQVLTNQSRIPARITFLKPLSAAIAIGTGGPFGAEGPIIVTGGALGSLAGQVLKTTAFERKTLLSAGAAAGMAATFGSPVSAVLLAIELLLFEYHPRSLIPVALAAVTATGVRMTFVGAAPVFAMQDLVQPSGAALASYVVLGALVGVASVGVTRAVYAVEDGFERLPIHWMWWPALGGVAVGSIGYFAPRTMGVGYDNIEHILSGGMLAKPVLVLCTLKFLSWAISLGSGTSGGTLAPLLTIGGGLGATLGTLGVALAPNLTIDVRIAALVGMAAMFAGASRALLASVVFAFEATRQPLGLLPLLGGCTSAFLVSSLLMRNSIMTEKLARRGVRALGEYSADFLSLISVRECALRPVVQLRGDDSVETVRKWLASEAEGTRHQGFPVVDEAGLLIGVLTRRDLISTPSAAARRVSELIHLEAIVIYDDCSLRDAADCMARAHVGRLPVVSRAQPRRVIGILTRSDLVDAHVRRLDDHQLRPATLLRS
ncbi:MAG TPA: chloride channel protein [Polyangiales bacterium]